MACFTGFFSFSISIRICGSIFARMRCAKASALFSALAWPMMSGSG